MIGADPLGAAGKGAFPLRGVRPLVVRAGADEKSEFHQALDFIKAPQRVIALESSGGRVVHGRCADKKHTFLQRGISFQIAVTDFTGVIEGEDEFSTRSCDGGPAMGRDGFAQGWMIPADVVGK